MNKIIILTGVSGVGKSTIAEILKKDFNFETSISYTTRQKRDKEENCQHYYFISRKNFEQKIKGNFFLEYAEVFNNYYGTSKYEVESKLKINNVVMTLSIDGYLALKKYFKEKLIGIYLAPPSKEELKKRIQIRNSSDEEINFRLDGIFEQSKKESAFFDHILEPDTIKNCIEKILYIMGC